MVNPAQLLPPNSTALERALADVLPRPALDALADAPRWSRSDPPEAYLPWLVAEYGLADFTRYFPDARALLAAGIPWLRLRGSAAAVRLALSWIGMNGTLEQDGPLLQLDPGSPEAPDDLAEIRHLVEASVPAHVELYRLFHGYDRRVLHASSGDRWCDQFVTDDSGVWIDGLKLSFGRQVPLAASRPETPVIGRLYRLHAALILHPGILRWGVMHWGDAPVYNHPVQRGRLHGKGNAVGLAGLALLAGRRTRARAAFVLSESIVGEPNTRFGGHADTQANRFLWSDPDSPLSGFDPGRHRAPIDEVRIVVHGSSTVAAAPPGPSAGIRHRLHAGLAEWRGPLRMDGSLRWSDTRLGERTGSAAQARSHGSGTSGLGARASRYGWTGRWDGRRWGGDIGTTHQTLTA